MPRRGFTLIETLLVVVMIGIVTAIALPGLRAGAAKRNLRASRNSLVALYGQARQAAVQQGRSAGLRFDGARVFVSAEPGTGGRAYDTLGTVRDLGVEYGATLTSTLNPIMIDPKGFTLAQAVVKVTKAGYADSVVIYKYGRVAK